MDGLTFGVKADTSTGHFEVHDYNEDDELVTTLQTESLSTNDMNGYDKGYVLNQPVTNDFFNA